MNSIVAASPCCTGRCTPAQQPAPARETFCHPVVSMCPECLRTIPGEVVAGPDGVFMRKTCPSHGWFECIISSDLAAYERMLRSPRIVHLPKHTAMPVDKGCPDDCGLCPAHEQHTCLAIIEITSRCNLPCPVCLADSHAKGRKGRLALSCKAFGLKFQLGLLDLGCQSLQFGAGTPILSSAQDRHRLLRQFPLLEIQFEGLLEIDGVPESPAGFARQPPFTICDFPPYFFDMNSRALLSRPSRKQSLGEIEKCVCLARPLRWGNRRRKPLCVNLRIGQQPSLNQLRISNAPLHSQSAHFRIKHDRQTGRFALR